MHNNETTNVTINTQLVLTAFKKQIKVHLVLKNKGWRNGFVKEMNTDYFVFKDTENPLEPFFYEEIYNIKPYVTEEK